MANAKWQTTNGISLPLSKTFNLQRQLNPRPETRPGPEYERNGNCVAEPGGTRILVLVCMYCAVLHMLNANTDMLLNRQTKSTMPQSPIK